jgi:hypothetical protein
MKKLFLLGGSIFLLACSKNVPADTKPTTLALSAQAQAFIDYYQYPHQSGIIIQRITPVTQVPDNKGTLSAQLNTSNREVIQGRIEINGENFDFDTQYNYIHSDVDAVTVFDRINNIKAFDANNNLLVEQEIYAPAELNMAAIGDSIRVGSAISWNADPDNEHGLLIIASFDPTSALNENGSFDGYSPIVNYEHISSDNGDYDISANVLKDIPVGAWVDVRIFRGNFKTIETTTNSFGIEIFSEAKFLAIKGD